MDSGLNIPINSVSFGQISTILLREFYFNKISIPICPIGQNIDLSTQEITQEFIDYLNQNINLFYTKHSRKNNIFKLWHINGSLESLSEKQILLSFYELDNPTDVEINIVKNNHKVLFTSQYTVDLFNRAGCANVKYIPLCFDKYNFKTIEKQYFSDRIVFNLLGKLEKRKNHKKVIQSWLKKYGNNRKYHLQCSIFNPFLKVEDQEHLIKNIILENKEYYYISFLNFLQANSEYNDLLNSADIWIGLSGGEGWGLPEFHSVGLGKHGIIMNEHGYKGWANQSNSTLIKGSSKIEAYDGIFFNKVQPYNQGNIYDFDEDEFIDACEKTIAKVEKNKINLNGLKLQEEFSSEKFYNNIIKEL